MEEEWDDLEKGWQEKRAEKERKGPKNEGGEGREGVLWMRRRNRRCTVDEEKGEKVFYG